VYTFSLIDTGNLVYLGPTHFSYMLLEGPKYSVFCVNKM